MVRNLKLLTWLRLMNSRLLIELLKATAPNFLNGRHRSQLPALAILTQCAFY